MLLGKILVQMNMNQKMHSSIIGGREINLTEFIFIQNVFSLFFPQQAISICLLAPSLPCEISPEVQLKMSSYVPLCTFGNKDFF